MRTNSICARIASGLRIVSILAVGAAAAFGQQQVNLTAGPATATLPDGTAVPMWGYSCGAPVAGSTATCAASNPNAGGGWSPVVITVPTGQDLQINLTNGLSFTAGAGTNTVPTSIMIVGQVGGGLGTSATTAPSPTHPTQVVTWSTVGSGGTFTPPSQGPRVQSFSTEVAAGATTALTWKAPRAGTYLLESGTHPSIQAPMGLIGMVVVTAAPTANAGTETLAGTAYPGITYDAEVPMLLSEIDPVQNNAVSTAVHTAGFSETMVWSGQPNGCGNPSSSTYNQCYPPAVNYTPLYYLINGVAFNKTNASASLFPTTPATLAPASVTGSVLVRLVNAGLRMHVPSIVGSTTGTAGAGGFRLVAEDGNPVPGAPRVQSDVFMAAGKTYDVMINAPATGATAIPVYDRELSLSGNAVNRDAGMLAYISANASPLPAAPAIATAVARPDSYNSLVAGQPLAVSDVSKGVMANDSNVYGVTLLTKAASGVVTLAANGTFTYVPNTGSTATTDSFSYCANGTVTGTTCSSGITATVTLGALGTTTGGITLQNTTWTANTANYLSIKNPGVLTGASDAAGYPLKVVLSTVTPSSGLTVVPDANGGFTATTTSPGTYSFTFQAQNSLGVTSGSTATASITFPAGSGLAVTVLDGSDKSTTISDYRWIIEEDQTFYVDPKCTSNPPPAGCPTSGSGIVPTFGVNFHTSHMPMVAQGCTGQQSCEAGQTVFDPTTGTHIPAVCDVGNGVCRPDTTGNGLTAVLPSQVVLDPTKRYYISILPGDAANPFYGASPTGHGMGGAPIAAGQTSVTILTQPSPYPPGKLSVFVFEDDFPLNGEQDAGGGVDVLAPNEPGLGGFQIHLWDAMGGNGDFTGQMTYDMFNQPLSNSLAGTIDPATGQDACPISPNSSTTFGTNGISASATGAGNVISVAGLTVDPNQVGNTLVIKGGTGFTPGTYTISAVDTVNKTWTLTPAIAGTQAATGAASKMTGLRTEPGITGMIVTCPKYEADGVTLSPLAGQAVVANLMPGRFGVIATPGADRIARGEEWLQTNTLDGQKAHDSFVRIGEPSYFQEFGPANYHVTVGFANPAIINARLPLVCSGTDVFLPGQGGCNNSITGKVTMEHYSRPPDERLYSSGSFDAWYFTQCYVSVGDPDGEDFAFTKCNADGTFTLSGLPTGDWRVTILDKWNDMLIDGLSTPVALTGSTNVNMGDIATNQWQINLYTRTCVDDNKDGICQKDEGGIPLINTAVRYRDGSLGNNLQTDFSGVANFNETFPLFSWYVVETDTTRYKNTGTHVVYDVGGPVDWSPSCGATGYPPCGNSTIGKYLANTAELVSLPTNLRVPGAVYCANADCSGYSIAGGPSTSAPPSNCTSTSGVINCSTTLSSGRIDPPWVGTEGLQAFSDQNNFMEFGKTPYIPGENGGIHGHVIYASTRPFDDPQMLVQTQWEPLVPHVAINLYKEGFAADGVTPTLTLVDTTQTSSWDDWAQGFRSDGMPNMSCPGQSTSDLFYFSLYNQPNYLNWYNSQHGGPAAPALPANSQFKCYDAMHNWNQIQPAPYDGMYSFPSVTGINPSTGQPAGTNCTACTTNPDSSDPYRYGLPMLPAGKYVVEVVLPPGYELVKEEDKNILIGDNYIAPVAQQFGGLGNVFILPDQASIGAAYNANNAQNPTQSLGASPENGIVPGFVPEPVWPCVGEARIVPDYISLYPQSKQVSPFAGATRNLCDRKEVTLGDQMGAIAKFYIYTSTHIASKFTGVITDDFTSEFDPFAPTFGEKFAPPNLPVSVKDWTGNEISRVYSDHWGAYNGLTYSTWEVNPPNPTGYSPTMMVFCMNDPGTASVPDLLFNSAYSQFCYELPFMPGQTAYLDTPVVPTSAFAGAGYNNPDCAYPDATPAIASVTSSDIAGPWVSAAGTAHTLTITALGDQTVNNYGYSGPSATTPPFNQKTVTRHYGFGTTQGTGTVTIGGANAPVTSWSDTTITVSVPSGVPPCAIQQQQQYGGPPPGHPALCGELVITAGNGKQSVDTVTVTIGGKTPTLVSGTAPLTQYGYGAIQTAIDNADPGDLIIVPPGVYQEMVIMWKPVRLQGVGAASSVINANTQPAGKLDPWRARVSCLFGLATNGQPYTGGNTLSSTNPNPFDPTNTFTCGGWPGFTAKAAVGNVLAGTETADPQVDRLPLEGILGWDTTVNGNLAQLLQEPTLMGAYEGSGIVVLSKGVNVHGAAGYYGSGGEAAFPTGTTLLTSSDCGHGNGVGKGAANPYPSNFSCNPSSIDALSITDSSQGGGGIFAHAWAHNLQVANNRVYNNIGTLSGGISIGQGESPDIYANGAASDSDPGSCNSGAGLPPNTELPYCFDLNVNVHNNYVASNSSIGDELFSGTPAGAGGASFCTGADYYKFNYNWVCGNLSSGDGGGFAHIGFIWDGDVEHNTVIFNQSTNPTIATNGGGIIVMGAAPDGSSAAGVECGGTAADADCTPGLPDGTGPNLIINANLIMGNAAESGSGGGLRLQSVNGTEITAFPNGNPKKLTTPAASQADTPWNFVQVTNNIITNNVAGWDGGGVSLQDALAVNLVNNTIASNDSTASSGVLFNTLGAPLASAPGATCQQQTGSPTCNSTTSLPQPAGLVSTGNSPQLTATFTGLTSLTCPAGHPNCLQISNPVLANNIFWQNHSYYIGVGSLSAQYQQNVVSLYDAFSGTAAPSQASTGACPAGTSYWDIGVRGDRTVTGHESGFTLNPTYSVLTSTTGYGSSNISSNPTLVSQYCNGSRIPPEFGGSGWQVPPGISDATVPNPIFNLMPSATVDEGNNWINMSWGPLSLTNPTVQGADGNWGGGAPLGNYAPAVGSPAIDAIPSTAPTYPLAPKTDFFGNKRPDVGALIDIGAVEYQAPAIAVVTVTGGPLAFGNQTVGTTSASQTLTLRNVGGANFTGLTVVVTAPFSRPGAAAGGTCTGTLAAGTSCTINIVFSPTTTGAANGTATITGNAVVTGSPVALSGTGVAITYTATVSPSPLAFGNWATGTTSAPLAVTVTNTGTGALAGGTFTFGGGTPQPFSRPAGAAGGTCGAALAVGASCTINVVFAPAAGTANATAFSRTLTVAYTGATVTPTPVSLTGTSLTALATVSITPNPLTITLPTGTITGTGTVTLTNTAPAGGAQITVSSVTVSGGSLLTYFFNKVVGQDTCTGATLAPGGTCTVGVRFTNVLSPRGVNRAGTITFTDSATGSPQTGGLIGHANP